MKNKILITICARGGSKGLKDKNIKLLNNVPLIVYSINLANKFSKIYKADIAISSDSKKILKIASQNGLASNYVRPTSLSNDDVGKIETIEDLILFEENFNNKKYDIILDLDVTSPLRNLNDLISAYEKLIQNYEALNLFSVSNCSKNPYFNMIELGNNDYVHLVKKGKFLTRQSAPKVYELNASFYFYKRVFFDLKHKHVITNKSIMYNIDHICFDIDHLIDFEFMNYLITSNKLNFKF